MGYQQEFQEEFGGGYSMNEDFGDDSYEDNGLPEGYFPPQIPVQVQQPPVRQVAPGEAYPPPAKVARITGFGQYGTKPLLKRGERGGRHRMTTGKTKMVQALTAAGVNDPRKYIPNLMNSQVGPLARFMKDEMEEESPNMLPLNGVRGFRVPMPQFGGPRPGPLMRPRAPMGMGQGGFGGPRPNPGGTFRPVFRNPSNSPGGRLLPPNYQTYRPTRPGQPNPMMQMQRMQTMQRPQSVLDIDFSADIDCY